GGWGLDRGRLYRKGLSRWLEKLNISSIGGRFMTVAGLGMAVLVAVLGSAFYALGDHPELKSLLYIQLLLSVLGALGLFAVAGINARQISRPLSAARDFVFQIAAGNLAARISQDGSAEVAHLSESLDVMLKSLGRIASD